MKNYVKVLFLIASLLTITVVAVYADTPGVNTEQVAQQQEVTAGSVYTDVKEGVAEVHQDVKDVVPVLYQDIKGALQSLAGPLKVGVEHVYGILVKQQVVNAVTWTIIDLLFLITGITLFIAGLRYGDKNKHQSGNWRDGDEVLPILGIIITLIGLIVTLWTISDVVSGFVNPEYGAIQEILSLIRR